MNVNELVIKQDNDRMDNMITALSMRNHTLHNNTLKNCMSDFQKIEHRLEFVAKIGGISFINDSKSTNVNSTWWSLESQKQPITWIAGGMTNNNNYETIMQTVINKVKNIICFGKAGIQIKEFFSLTSKTIIIVDDLESAIKTSYKIAQKGETVLFSPACSSFDIYNNYEERGIAFKKAVRAL